MKWLKSLLTTKTEIKTHTEEYAGFSDFLRRAPLEKKVEVFTEAARRASEDQKKMIKKAEMVLS